MACRGGMVSLAALLLDVAQSEWASMAVALCPMAVDCPIDRRRSNAEARSRELLLSRCRLRCRL